MSVVASRLILVRDDQRRLVHVRDEIGSVAWGEAMLPTSEAEKREWRRCPYAGTRHGHPLPMNVSALREMTARWDDVLAIASAVRRSHRRRATGDTTALGDAVVVTSDLMCISAFLHDRVGGMQGAPFPAVVSALTKAFLDVENLLEECTFQAFLGDGDGADPTVDGLYELAEERQLFIGRRGVCAGPPHMVKEAIAVVLGGSSGDPDQGRAMLDRWCVSEDALWSYGRAFHAITRLRQAVACRIQHVAGCVAADEDPSFGPVQRRIGEWGAMPARYPYSMVRMLPSSSRVSLAERFVRVATQELSPRAASVVAWATRWPAEDLSVKRMLDEVARLELRAAAALHVLAADLATTLGRDPEVVRTLDAAAFIGESLRGPWSPPPDALPGLEEELRIAASGGAS